MKRDRERAREREIYIYILPVYIAQNYIEIADIQYLIPPCGPKNE
jgi:hypothetical protein